MPYKAVIFDLDGTLLDTVADIGSAANRVLIKAGYSPHPLIAYQQFVGSGVAVLFERALPQNAADSSVVTECVSNFEREYETCWNQATLPYDGICELLDKLTGMRFDLAILSNKPDAFTKKCVTEYFPGYCFDPVFGQRQEVPRKPQPEAVWEIMQYHGVSAEQTVFVGDSEIDVLTAQNAGIFAVGVTWGYRLPEALIAQGVNLLIDEPRDLLSFIEENS